MKFLVTGGTGFVGSHLIEALLADGHEVAVLVRDPARLQTFSFRDRVQQIRGDLFASEPFPADTEAVLHLAAVTKVIRPVEFDTVNHQGTRHFLQRLQRLPRLGKVVAVSSLAAAGPSSASVPATETEPARPVSLYGRSKWLAEQAVFHEAPCPAIIVRPPIVFGERDLDMLAALKILKKGLMPILGKRCRYSVIYVKDLISGILHAALSPLKDELFYLTNPDPVDWEDFMALAAAAMAVRRPRAIRIPLPAVYVLAQLAEARCRLFRQRAIFNRDKYRELRCHDWICSGAKSERMLHFVPRFSLPEALAATIGWYREEGLL